MSFLLTATPVRADTPPPPREKPNIPAVRPPLPETEDAKGWLPKLADGYAQARRHRQAILVKVGSASCPWCRKLDVELRDAGVAKELARWTLVALDVATADRDARALAVGPIPALRVLTPDGRVVATHDGYLPAEELLAWLTKHHAAAAAMPAEELTATGPPDAAAVTKLVGELKQRDPALREAAIRRLLPYPKLAATPVAESFAKAAVRHDAVQEFARRATAADEPLLLDRFGNPDLFVRELSL